MISAKVDNKTRRGIYRRDGYRCALCDSTHGLQIHHIIHRSEGGTNNASNLITLCWKCHAAAHGTRVEDYPAHIDKDWIDSACIEYISDWYAEVLGEPWNPWDAGARWDRRTETPEEWTENQLHHMNREIVKGNLNPAACDRDCEHCARTECPEAEKQNLPF